MPGPTHASVTDVPCTCRYLQRTAEMAGSPIRFDAALNAYHITYQEPGLDGLSTLSIHHCPFCGGAAPASTRERLFHPLPDEEVDRLLELLRPLRTMEAALETLGPPDHDIDATDTWPRTLIYSNLSPVADAYLQLLSDDTLQPSVLPKPLPEG